MEKQKGYRTMIKMFTGNALQSYLINPTVIYRKFAGDAYIGNRIIYNSTQNV